MQRVDISSIPAKSSQPKIDPQKLKAARSGALVGLFCPLHYEPNYAYPLLVWIDSTDGAGQSIQHALPQVSMRNYVGAAAVGDRNRLPTSVQIFDAVHRAREQYNIHAGRIFVAGIGDGGGLALRIALENPHLFAAAASLGGPLPEYENRLANLKSARELPMLICQGRDSIRYSDDQTCEHLRLFHAAGMHVTLRQYPCGDEFHPPMLIDLNRWLMERVTG